MKCPICGSKDVAVSGGPSRIKMKVNGLPVYELRLECQDDKNEVECRSDFYIYITYPE